MNSSIPRCLLCADILRNICVQAYEGGYDADCRADVAALNLTCRAFHRVASKVLWSRLFGLRPLVKCMPPDVWADEVADATDGCLSLIMTRPPDPSDWDRFQANAALVTSFKRFGLDPDLDDDAYCTLCLYRPGPPPFLPNLQELVWEESDADVFEYGYQLLGPKLTTLHVGQPPSDTLLLPILRSLHVNCPLLRHLSVQCRSAVGPLDPVVSRAIMQLHHLETIDLYLPLLDDALVHLATLPSLSVAKIFLPRNTGIHERLEGANVPIFPSLAVFHVNVIRLEPSLAAVVDLMTSSQLSEVHLSAAHDPSSVALESFLTALSRSPSRDALSALRLSFPLPSSISLMRSLNAIPPLDHPECVLDITTLQPLFACPELTELAITSFFLRPDDTFVRALAAACPRLQSLRLVPPYCAGRLAEVSLDGLLPLLTLCPKLSELALPLNAIRPPSTSTGARGHIGTGIDSSRVLRRSVRPSRLILLDVGDSPISAPEDVAALLSAYCTHPEFAIVSAGALDGDGDPEHVRAREAHAALWTQTAHLVRLLAMVRREEREHWMALSTNVEHAHPASNSNSSTDGDSGLY